MNATLNLTKGCCRDRLKLAGVISPFRRAIALESWEGPVSGVAQCGKCSACWAFTQLDHDHEWVLRAFLLRKLHDGAIDQLTLGYSKLGKPSWPSGIWTPPVLDKIPEGSRQAAMELERAVFDHAGPPEFVIALKHLINGRVLAVAEYAVGVDGWLQLLVPDRKVS